jgi:hypothetical protein
VFLALAIACGEADEAIVGLATNGGVEFIWIDGQGDVRRGGLSRPMDPASVEIEQARGRAMALGREALKEAA